MCLITEQKKPIRIRKDMTVYKVVRTYKNKITNYSNLFLYIYILNKLHKEKLFYDNKPNSYADDKVHEAYPDWSYYHKYTHVHCGFHSAVSKDRFDDWSYQRRRGKIAKCTIPKGSLVFKDKTGLIASNQIIINEILN